MGSACVQFVAIALLPQLGSPDRLGSPLIFEGGFETAERGVGRLGAANLEAALARTRLVTAPVRAGRHALEITLERGGGDHRTDFYIQDIGGRFKVGREYWFGFSVWFPEDWQTDTLNELFVPWVRTTRTPAGPQLAIYLNGESYVVRKRWDPDPADGTAEVEYENLWRRSLSQTGARGLTGSCG